MYIMYICIRRHHIFNVFPFLLSSFYAYARVTSQHQTLSPNDRPRVRRYFYSPSLVTASLPSSPSQRLSAIIDYLKRALMRPFLRSYCALRSMI